MINKVFIIFLLTFLSLNSQNKDDIFFQFNSKFGHIEEVFSFSDIDISKNDFQELSFEALDTLLRTNYNEPFIKEINTSINSFYAVGSIDILEKYKGYIIYHTFSHEKSSKKDKLLFLAIFSGSKLINFLKIGQLISGLESFNNSVIIYPNNTILKFSNLDDELFRFKTEKYIFSEIDDDLDYDLQILNDEELKKVSKIKYAYKDIKNERYVFNSGFFLSKNNLIPLTFAKGLNKSKSLFSINGEKDTFYESFFIDSKKIKHDKEIIFIINKYDYTKYSRVCDVSYLIVDENQTLKDSKRIAHIYIGSDGKVKSINEAEVIIEKDAVLIKNLATNQIIKRIPARTRMIDR